MLHGDMSTAAEAQPGTWIAVGVLVGLALALLVGVLLAGAGRLRTRRARPAPTPAADAAPAPTAEGAPAPPAPAGPAYPDDDLPGFLDAPPGSPRPRSVQPAAGSEPVVHQQVPTAPPDGGATAAGRDAGPAHPGRGTTLGIGGAVALLVAAVVVAAAGGGRDSGPAAASLPAPVESAPAGTVTPGLDPTVPTTSAPPSATATEPGARALESVPLGGDGLAVSVSFGGVVLEQRAVGLTVTYPSLSVTTDGRRSLAHLRLPTYNCLTAGPTAEPPADPAAAGCATSLVEYAELGDPQLQVHRDGDRLDVAGLFPTYLRPTGSSAVWTDRAYQLTASTAPAGPVTEGRAAATGVVRIGLGSAQTVADLGVNVVQLPR